MPCAQIEARIIQGIASYNSIKRLLPLKSPVKKALFYVMLGLCAISSLICGILYICTEYYKDTADTQTLMLLFGLTILVSGIFSPLAYFTGTFSFSSIIMHLTRKSFLKKIRKYFLIIACIMIALYLLLVFFCIFLAPGDFKTGAVLIVVVYATRLYFGSAGCFLAFGITKY